MASLQQLGGGAGAAAAADGLHEQMQALADSRAAHEVTGALLLPPLLLLLFPPLLPLLFPPLLPPLLPLLLLPLLLLPTLSSRCSLC